MGMILGYIDGEVDAIAIGASLTEFIEITVSKNLSLLVFDDDIRIFCLYSVAAKSEFF